MNIKRWENALVFGKAQLSAFVGGMTDYAIMILLTGYFDVFLVYSIWFSGAVGAVVNFNINKRWTFKPMVRKGQWFFGKFILVVILSILLKSAGTYFLANTGLDYKIGRLVVDLLVSLGFNFTLQKYWVFGQKKVSAEPAHS